jgi:hypothetical protein
VLTPHLLEHVKALKPEVIRCLTSEPSHTAAVAIDQSIRHATNWQHLSQVWEDIYAAYRAGDIDLDVADQFTSLIRSRAREMPESDDGVLLEMPLGEVAVSGLCREIHSKVLDERVLRAADNAELPADTPLAVYRASELQLLDGVSPEMLRAVHQVRQAFDGEVVEDRPDDHLVPSEPLWDPQCYACGQASWWRKDSGERICGVCHPQRGR